MNIIHIYNNNFSLLTSQQTDVEKFWNFSYNFFTAIWRVKNCDWVHFHCCYSVLHRVLYGTPSIELRWFLWSPSLPYNPIVHAHSSKQVLDCTVSWLRHVQRHKRFLWIIRLWRVHWPFFVTLRGIFSNIRLRERTTIRCKLCQPFCPTSNFWYAKFLDRDNRFPNLDALQTKFSFPVIHKCRAISSRQIDFRQYQFCQFRVRL